MPSAGFVIKRRDSLGRQMSLQGPGPPSSSTHQLKKQLSESDKKLVSITGMGFTSQKTRASSAEGLKRTITPTKRPKPVKIAWTDRRCDSLELDGGRVEVVAKRCEGQPRPSYVKPSRSPNFGLIDEHLTYSKQQLAERLRAAWKEREQKSNLDIFLARPRTELSRPHTEESTTSDRPTVDEKLFDINDATNVNKIKINVTQVMTGDEIEKNDDIIPTELLETKTAMSASARRASFRSNQTFYKTIVSSFSDEDNYKCTEKSQQRVPLIRMSSAPTSNDNGCESSARRTFSSRTTLDYKSTSTSFISKHVQVKDDSQKVKQTRRKLKSTSRRHKDFKDHDSSGDEKTDHPKQTKRRSGFRSTGDIVTMVSLVSPAESDDEDALFNNSVPLIGITEKSSAEIRSTSEPDPPQGINTAQFLQKFAALRKTNKTVSFQNHPPINRTYSANFPLRRAPPGAPIIIPTPIPNRNMQNEIQSDRSQGHNVQDIRGIKRRLSRAKTIPNDIDENNSTSEDNSCRTDDEKKDDETLEDDEEEEPYKTPKEKECWILYRKMIEKGVAVSYETVLRGMLTPTEYRMHKNQLARC